MPITDTQREAILVLSREGISSREIASRLELAVGTVAAVKANITRGSYDATDSTTDEGIEVAKAVDAAFGLERDLQAALRQSIEQLEPGLTIADNNHEKVVPSGRIDITARDSSGKTVVIELKVGTADRDSIGQILAYMGDLSSQEAAVRGILVARDFDPRAVSAAPAVQQLRLVRYGFQFMFDAVGSRP
jgi:hypothetical protein